MVQSRSVGEKRSKIRNMQMDNVKGLLHHGLARSMPRRRGWMKGTMTVFSSGMGILRVENGRIPKRVYEGKCRVGQSQKNKVDRFRE